MATATVETILKDLESFLDKGAEAWRGRKFNLTALPGMDIVQVRVRAEPGPDALQQAIEDVIQDGIQTLNDPLRSAADLLFGFAKHGKGESWTERSNRAARKWGVSDRSMRRPSDEYDGLEPRIWLAERVAEAIQTAEAELDGIGGPPVQLGLPSQTADRLRTVFGALLPSTRSDAAQLFGTAIDKSIGGAVVRDNWHIDLRFDLDKVKSDGRIIELLEWSYDLMNITTDTVTHQTGVTSLNDDHFEKRVVSFVRVDSDGKETDMLSDYAFRGDQMFATAKVAIDMEPGIRYRTKMKFIQGWPVNPEFPQIHNSFSPRQPCLHTSLRFEIPEGYEIGVLLTHHYPEGKYFEGVEEFELPEPLLSGNCIEYVLRPRSTTSQTGS